MDADYEDIGENGGNDYGAVYLGLVADADTDADDDNLGLDVAKYLVMLMMKIWVFGCCKIFSPCT